MQSAQSWALTQLTQKHRPTYRNLYEKHRALNPMIHRAKSQWAAKCVLMHAYREDYLELYELGLAKGYPRRSRRYAEEGR